MAIELRWLRQPKVLRDGLLRDDEEGRGAGTGRGGKVWLLKLGETNLAHGMKRQLSLLACPQIKPRQPLPHILEAEAKTRMQRFIH